MDGADVCRTSSWASRRPPDVISAVAILDPRWRRRKWRHPGPGAGFSIPIAVRGAKWRPFRFRSPSWMTSFPGNEVIQDGDRKRKGRHFAPRTAIGSKNPPYTTLSFLLVVLFYVYFSSRRAVWNCVISGTHALPPTRRFIWIPIGGVLRYDLVRED